MVESMTDVSLDPDPEAGWGELNGRTVAMRWFGETDSGTARFVGLLVDVLMRIPRLVVSVHRKWGKMPSANRRAVWYEIFFWTLCCLVVATMGLKSGLEKAAAAARIEFETRGSCAVCIDNAVIDISRPCVPVTVHDFVAHDRPRQVLQHVLTGHIRDGHQSITAYSAGSRACVIAMRHHPELDVPGYAAFILYNPVEVDLDADEEQPPPPPPPLPPPPPETAERRHAAEQRNPRQPTHSMIRIRPAEGPTTTVPNATGPVKATEPRREHTSVKRMITEEPSDFYEGVTVARNRPSIVKLKYYVFGDQGVLTPKYITLDGLEAVGALNAVEVLNGTHHALYAPVAHAPTDA